MRNPIQKIFLALFILSSFTLNAFAMPVIKEIDAANKLAKNGVIVDKSSNTNEYRVNDEITRGEMAKITLKLSKKEISDKCDGIYNDLNSSNWACKYAESGNKYGFFASNKYFNPGNNITKIEALKMVMLARGIEKSANADWRAGYVEAGVMNGILEEEFMDYDSKAKRGWIFIIATNEVGECGEETCELDALIDGLINDIVGETGSSEEKCGIENCHGLDIKCGPNIAEVCDEIYKAGDSCRQFATCEVVNGKCSLQKSSSFDLCKSCVESCKTKYPNEREKFGECEEKCSK